jgi:hypothetical protein
MHPDVLSAFDASAVDDRQPVNNQEFLSCNVTQEDNDSADVQADEENDIPISELSRMAKSTATSNSSHAKSSRGGVKRKATSPLSNSTREPDRSGVDSEAEIESKSTTGRSASKETKRDSSSPQARRSTRRRLENT